MKPKVTKLVGAPLTSLLCCPTCYQLISYDAGEKVVQCRACGATAKEEEPLSPLHSPRDPA